MLVVFVINFILITFCCSQELYSFWRPSTSFVWLGSFSFKTYFCLEGHNLPNFIQYFYYLYSNLFYYFMTSPAPTEKFEMELLDFVVFIGLGGYF